jgi:hypothetical protein
MNRDLLSIFVGVAVIGAACTAPAQVIYSTGFEDPPLAANSQLLGQDGWSDAIPPFLNPAAATITGATAHTGLQSLQVRGQDLVSSDDPDTPEYDPITDPYDAVGSYRRPVDYDAAAAGYPIVRLQTDVYLDGPTSTTPSFVSQSLAARSGDGGVGEIELGSDGNVYAYTGNFDSPTLFSAPISLNAWHTFAIDVDFLNDQYAFYVDGAFLVQHAFDAGFTSDVLLRGSVVTYAYPDTAATSEHRSDYTFRFDNFSITAVPEPASAVMATGWLVASVVRPRRRATGTSVETTCTDGPEEFTEARCIRSSPSVFDECRGKRNSVV